MFYQYLLLAVCAHLSRCFSISDVAINVNGEVAVDLLRDQDHVPRVSDGPKQQLVDNYTEASNIPTKETLMKDVTQELKELTDDDDNEVSAKAKIQKLRDIAPKRAVEEPSDLSKENELTAGREKIENVTVAPIFECPYEYPTHEQMETMLGSMMNQLTKMFMRMQVIIHEEDARRSQETRFRVISKTNNAFFDDIYGNMTQEYTILFNSSMQNSNMSGVDPCSHQPELRQLWSTLLDQSQLTLRRAVWRCVEAYLQQRAAVGPAGASGASRGSRARMRRALRRDLVRARAAHLAELCDTFQLCYDDLLH